MKNKSLALDYIERAKKRLKALETLFKEEAWADVVREAQEIVELSLKGLLRKVRVEAPRIHDVSAILKDKKDLFSSAIRADLKRLCEISHKMRRDRELSFYGSEDLTPSEFYGPSDAKTAFNEARWVVEAVAREFK